MKKGFPTTSLPGTTYKRGGTPWLLGRLEQVDYERTRRSHALERPLGQHAALTLPFRYPQPNTLNPLR